MYRAEQARLAAFALSALLLLCSGTARAQDLIADLSSHRVDITTGFTGADLLLFGSVDDTGDIVVTVTGPKEQVTVRRKNRVAGIWMNTRSVTFGGVPNFYAVAANRPLEEIAAPEVLARQEIGADHLRLRAQSDRRELSRDEEAEFREALIRRKRAQGLYAESPGDVTVIASKLFRTQVHFPATLATGVYTAVVYLIRDGRVVHAQTTPLVVEKVGVGAEVYAFAHNRSATYGIAAIIIAVVAGWLAAAVFRKV
ncbi:TIGR02186 family protein [Nisaea acidiphila]|uniref:TIGR02186 family protein n=1 Tax=Nisaea acidiphila TaxID=1862145 RepID=A0A9J7AP65_9PROT|nr:TIGR02186 family protein [Nisaea acidiphila]UUX49411.1 TIGR02186 family protein [Nisaea acidiphila]